MLTLLRTIRNKNQGASMTPAAPALSARWRNPPEPPDLEQAMDEILGVVLRESGHRLTDPRRTVWRVLYTAAEHLTAEQVTERARAADPGANRASVYRSLSLFADLGLARELNLGADQPTRWETAHADDQFHLVCEGCEQVVHHAGRLVEEVRSHLLRGHGFAARRVELHVSGRCARCSS